MLGILVGWAFVTFIYFKVAFDALFRDSISIVAALLLAILIAIYVFIGSSIQASQLLRYNWTPGAVPARLSELVAKTLLSFVGLSVVFVLVSRAIIFGFSKSLSKEIKLFLGHRSQNLEESFFIFLGIVMLPLLLHYAMSLFGTYSNANAKS